MGVPRRCRDLPMPGPTDAVEHLTAGLHEVRLEASLEGHAKLVRSFGDGAQVSGGGSELELT